MGLTVTHNKTQATVGQSDWTQTHAVTLEVIDEITLGGNTAGAMAGISQGTMLLAGGNNITLSQNANSVTISGGAAGAADGINALVVNGGVSTLSTTLSLSNSNNVTFGHNAGVITATASYSQSTAPGAFAAGTQTATSGTLVFSNSNNVTFGLSGSTRITASASYSQSTAPGAIAAGTQTATSGTLVFSNSNGITFGLSGSTRVTASHNGLTTAAQSDHSHGNPTLALTNLTGTTASNSAGLTLSLSAGAAGGADGVNALVVNGGASTQSTTLTLSNSNNVTFGLNAGVITASASYSAESSHAVTVGGNSTSAGAGYALISTGTMLLAGGNNVTLSQNGNSVTISGGAAGAADGVNALVVNGGASTASTTLSLSNSNNVSFGLNAGVITATASYSQSTAPGGLAASGIATTFTSGTVVISGSNNITISTAAQAIIISGANTHAQQTGISSIAANAASTVSGGAVVFSNSNGVSFGLNGSTMTASHNALTSQSNQAFSADASSTFQTLTFQNSNGVSFSNNAGALRVAHALQYTSNTTDIITGRAGLGTTFAGANISASMTLNTAGLNLSASVAAPSGAAITQTVGMTNSTAGGSTAGTSGGATGDDIFYAFVPGSNITLSQSINGASGTLSIYGGAGGGGAGISAGTQSVSSGTVVFSNSNSITFGMTNSSVVTASFSESTHGHGGIAYSGNTSGTLSTISSGTAILAGGNNVTISQNGQSATISAGAYAVSNSAGSFTFQTLNFSNANNVTFGTSAGGIVTASVAAPGAAAVTQSVGLSNVTAGGSGNGTTGMVTGDDIRYVFVPGSNITMSQSIDGSSGTLTIYGTSGGGGAAATVSRYYNCDLGASTTLNAPQNSLFLFPLTLYSAVSASTLAILMSLSGTITSATTAQPGLTLRAALYSQNATNSTRFDTLWTEGNSITYWNSGTSSYSYAYSNSGGETTGSSAGSNLGTRSVMGVRIISFYPNQVFTTGQYIFALNLSSSTAGYSAAMSRQALYANNPAGVGMGTIGGTTAASIGLQSGLYSVTTGGLPASLGLSELRVNSNVIPYFQMGAV